jgi:hypothetical protein
MDNRVLDGLAPDKGKPLERVGRKAADLRLVDLRLR